MQLSAKGACSKLCYYYNVRFDGYRVASSPVAHTAANPLIGGDTTVGDASVFDRACRAWQYTTDGTNHYCELWNAKWMEGTGGNAGVLNAQHPMGAGFVETSADVANPADGFGVMCTNKYPLESQYCMRRFGEPSPSTTGGLSCVDPTGTQGIEMGLSNDRSPANQYFGTVAAYKKSTGFQPDATLKSSPVCREVFDYGWKSMEATKQKEFDVFNVRVFDDASVGHVGGVGHDHLWGEAAFNDPVTISENGIKLGAMTGIPAIAEPLLVETPQQTATVKSYGGRDGVYNRLAFHLGVAGGNDQNGYGYDRGGLKLGVACAVGDGLWAHEHRRPNMTSWRCVGQKWEMVEAREVAISSPAPYRICADIDPNAGACTLTSCRKRCLGMARDFNSLLDLAADPSGGTWHAANGVGNSFGVGSPWAARFAHNRVYVAYEFDTVSA
jgi:hypothetical protein